ncbi:hypothetical protein IWZ00DRAFT_359012 [Phyllosticta capitalensis]
MTWSTTAISVTGRRGAGSLELGCAARRRCPPFAGPKSHDRGQLAAERVCGSRNHQSCTLARREYYIQLGTGQFHHVVPRWQTTLALCLVARCCLLSCLPRCLPACVLPAGSRLVSLVVACLLSGLACFGRSLRSFALLRSLSPLTLWTANQCAEPCLLVFCVRVGRVHLSSSHAIEACDGTSSPLYRLALARPRAMRQTVSGAAEAWRLR